MIENLKFEQGAVIKFFTKYEKNATEIENELRIVYGGSTTCSIVVEWTVEFKRGRRCGEQSGKIGERKQAN